MAIRVLPSKLLKKVAPEKVVEKLVTQDLTLNRAAVAMLTKSESLSKKKLTEVAIRVIRGYRERFGDEREQGASVAEATEEALNGKKQMVQRVQNLVVTEIVDDVKQSYRGEFYEWLPSDAEEPDPLHQLKYGKRFRIGRGEMPGDRFGCRCGMNILVKEDKLEL